MKTQGDSLFDIVDKRDHGTVQAQLLHGSGTDTQPDRQVSFFCRMNMSRTLKRQGGFGDVKVGLICWLFYSFVLWFTVNNSISHTKLEREI